jgi:aryl-alcohol dehydrogenase-like predicted oxidoreductase
MPIPGTTNIKHARENIGALAFPPLSKVMLSSNDLPLLL